MSLTTNPSTQTSPDTTNRPVEVPPFVPHPWIQGGHRQTIFGRFWPSPKLRIASTYAEVDVLHGDRVSVLESIPSGWQPGDPAAVLVHGLGGSARSPYMTRVTKRLVERNRVRVVRMNLRGAGSGFGLARSYYHSGKTEDLRRVAAWLARRVPESPIALVGFSLGANLVLKLAGEAATEPVVGLDCVVAANPPVDLEACCRTIQDPRNRIYDKNFVRLLKDQVGRLHTRFPELSAPDLSAARTLLDFDELYTAPRNNFLDAQDYYSRSSARRWIGRIQVQGLVVHALDDPFIPAEPFASIRFPPNLDCELIPHGGHLGYWSRDPWDGDRRWLDARISHWLGSRWDRKEINVNNL